MPAATDLSDALVSTVTAVTGAWGPGGQTLWQQAEAAAVASMRGLGFEDAALTTAGADRGLDVIAVGAAAQVKATSATVGRPDVQRLVGAGISVGQLVFYSLNGYSTGAVEYADEAGVALFTFGPELRTFAANEVAEGLVEPAGQQHDASATVRARPRRAERPPGWRGLPVPVKVLAGCAVVAFSVMLGPLVFVVGRVAMHRAGHGFGAASDDNLVRRRVGVVVAGVLGTLLLGSVMVQNLWWALFGGQPEDGSPGVGAVVGVVVGAAVLIGINAVVESGRADKLPVPSALGPVSPLPGHTQS